MVLLGVEESYAFTALGGAFATQQKAVFKGSNAVYFPSTALVRIYVPLSLKYFDNSIE